MGTPAGTYLPTGGVDPVAAYGQAQGKLAAGTSWANSGIGPGSTMQAVSEGGIDFATAEQTFNDFLNNALINTQTTANKLGGANGGTSATGNTTGTGGFNTGFNQGGG